MFTNYLGTGAVQWLVGTVAGTKKTAAYDIIRKDILSLKTSFKHGPCGVLRPVIGTILLADLCTSIHSNVTSLSKVLSSDRGLGLKPRTGTA